MIGLLLCLLVIPSALCITTADSNVIRFVVDFDASPEFRYNHVFHHFRSQLAVMEDDMMHSIAPEFRTMFQNNTDKFLDSNPEAYWAMQSLATIIDRPLWQTLLVNSVVDITSFCTSVVGRMSDGEVIHGRNLDFDFPTVLQTLVHHVYIRLNGRIIGEGACIAGYIGFYTGLRYNAFTVSYNVRLYPHTDMTEIAKNIEREWEVGVMPAQQAIQQALLYNTSYTDAVDFLSSQKINAPCYIILAGNSAVSMSQNEGIVLTREPYALNHTTSLDADHWYAIQTNTDWWLVPDERYSATVGYLEQLGQERLTMDTLVTDVLNQTGVLQSITIFTASMSAQLSDLNIYLTPLSP